jgi:putative transferase (TIGR04331 family)
MLLVTTALEATWGSDEDMLFLGEWCKRYDRKNVWSMRNAVTLPYIWADKGRMEGDANYVDRIYEKVLSILCVKFNAIHSTSHDERYWRILIGVWLGFILPILYQRWVTVESAISVVRNFTTISIENEVGYLSPQDMKNFADLMVTDEWNHALFSEILRFKNVAQKLVKVRANEALKARRSFREILKIVKDVVLHSTNFVLRPLQVRNSIVFRGTYLPLKKLFILTLKLRQVPVFEGSPKPLKFDYSKDFRLWTLDLDGNNEFERFLNTVIPQLVPRAYLEGYDKLLKCAESLHWPNQTRAIFTSNSHIFDDIAKCRISMEVERGSAYIIGQHGGGPLHKINFQTKHELDTCDVYLSPGNGNTFNSKIKPIGQFFAENWTNNPKGGGVLVQLMVPRYTYCMTSTVQAADFSSYQDDQFAFLNSLEPGIRSRFVVRLHAAERMLNPIEDYWREVCPEQKIDNGVGSVYGAYSDARLIVCTYAGTTYNLSIGENVPTVVFWNPAHSQLHESSLDIFDAMRRVGIFHDDPYSAASHINSIWNDVLGWWLSDPVQEVREKFSGMYCDKTQDITKKLYELMHVFRT